MNNNILKINYITVFLFLLLNNVTAQFNGQLDETFGNSGRVIIDVNPFGSTASALCLLADGSIILGGSSQSVRIFLAKLNSDGSFATNFGSGGVIEHALNAYYITCTGLDMQSDSSIVVTGVILETDTSMFERLYVARFNSDGTPDYNFADSGMYIFPVWYRLFGNVY